MLEHWPRRNARNSSRGCLPAENELAVIATAPHVPRRCTVGLMAEIFVMAARRGRRWASFSNTSTSSCSRWLRHSWCCGCAASSAGAPETSVVASCSVRRAAAAPDKVPGAGRTSRRHRKVCGDDRRLVRTRCPGRGPNTASRSELRPVAVSRGRPNRFEMIVTAFAAGDKAPLQPLLSGEVFQQIRYGDRRAHRRQGNPRDADLAARPIGHRRGRARRPHGAGDGEAGLAADQRDARDGRKHRRRRLRNIRPKRPILDFRARYAIHRSELGSRRHQQRLSAKGLSRKAAAPRRVVGGRNVWAADAERGARWRPRSL